MLQLLGAEIYPQVGINTTSPLGVFHLHGVLTDVIVNEDGNMGVGTLSPQAKIHIKTGGTAASPVTGLRIKDTNEGVNKILTAIDNSGSATWKQVKGSKGELLHAQKQTFPKGVRTTIKFYEYSGKSYISIPEDGNYLVFIRWWGNQTGLSPTGPINHTVIYLDRYILATATTTNADIREMYFAGSNAVGWFGFTTLMFASECKKGDKLSISLLPNYCNWYSGQYSYPSFIFLPSFLIVMA